MTVNELAAMMVDACEAEGIQHMLTGAFAVSYYGVPRATQDVDLVVDIPPPVGFGQLARRLDGHVVFDPQIQFDTHTWGHRHVGTTVDQPPLQVELFELFDDAFVREQFARRQEVRLPSVGRSLWLPTAEDLVIKKVRWGQDPRGPQRPRLIKARLAALIRKPSPAPHGRKIPATGYGANRSTFGQKYPLEVSYFAPPLGRFASPPTGGSIKIR